MSKALSASLEVPTSAGTYSAALEGLTGVDEVLMRRTPTPPLYSTGARWQVKEGDPSELRWRYPHDVLTTGWGDCQDLSAYRAAELRVTGEDPYARVRVYPTGFAPNGEPDRFHAVVARGNGLIEDPSVILGMPPIQGAPMSTNQLPSVNGYPPSPSGPSMSVCLGDECGEGEQLARVPDFAPSVRGPTFHVVPHVSGSGRQGWKGVYRNPMRDGTAIVGMTRTCDSHTAVVGDGASLMSRIGNAILNHPIISLLVAPEVYGATRLLMSPQGQAKAQVVQHAAGRDSDGWPADWGSFDAKIQGIANAIVGATRSAAISAANKAAAQSRGATRTRDTTSFAASGMVPPSRGGTTPGANPVLNPAMLNPANPFNTPGMPGYNPALPTMPNPYATPQPGIAPGANPANPYNAPGLPGYNPYLPSAPQGSPYNPQPSSSYGGGFGGFGDYNAPTAADFGLPSAEPYSGGADLLSPDMSYAFGDPSNQDAVASYFDPMSQLGPWSY